MDQYLTIVDKHHISTLFVLFDDCWNPTYQIGEQPEPKPGVHNSGWVRDPGDLLQQDSTLWPILEQYVRDVLITFKEDKRIVLWDLYNEPGNSNYGNKSMPLLQKVFQWGREVNPSQPLSVGVWNKSLIDLNRYQLQYSDVITYHNYGDSTEHQQWIDTLKTYQRPLICTEYMARTRNSTFATILPLLKKIILLLITGGWWQEKQIQSMPGIVRCLMVQNRLYGFMTFSEKTQHHINRKR